MTSSHNGKIQDVFSVFDAVLAQPIADVLGIWTTLPPTSATELAFDTTTGTNEEIPCWRAALPVDLDEANRCLCDGETRLLRFQQALLKVADRVASFAPGEFSYQAFSTSAKERILQGSPSFVVEGDGRGSIHHARFGEKSPQGSSRQQADVMNTAPTLAASPQRVEDLLQPEAELFRLLHMLQGPLLSFGISERASETWNKITEQFQAWASHLLRAVAHSAWVETYAGDQLIGRTSVSWAGDMQTVWRAGLEPAQSVLHQRTLDLALASRNTAMQLFLLVTQGCVKVSLLFAIPGGPLLVIPVVWHFVQRVLAEDSRQAP